MKATTTQLQFGRSKALLLFMIGLASCAATLPHPAKADDFRYRHSFERQHAVPYRHHGYNEHHEWRHHYRHHPYCTTRAVPYWDEFWGQWRTRYVRECW